MERRRFITTRRSYYKILLNAGKGDDVINMAGVQLRADVFAGAGNDYVIGTDGDDEIHGQDGNDTLIGGPGKDRLYGENGEDVLSGGEGNDLIDGGSGADKAYTGMGTDTLVSATAQEGEVPGLGMCDPCDELGKGIDLGLGLKVNLGILLGAKVNVLAKLGLDVDLKLKAGANVDAIIGIFSKLNVNIDGAVYSTKGVVIDVDAVKCLLAKVGVYTDVAVNVSTCLNVFSKLEIKANTGLLGGLLMSNSEKLTDCIGQIAGIGTQVRANLGINVNGLLLGGTLDVLAKLGLRANLGLSAKANIDAIIGVFSKLTVNTAGLLCSSSGVAVDATAIACVLGKLGVNVQAVASVDACVSVLGKLGIKPLGIYATADAKLSACINLLSSLGVSVRLGLGLNILGLIKL